MSSATVSSGRRRSALMSVRAGPMRCGRRLRICSLLIQVRLDFRFWVHAGRHARRETGPTETCYNGYDGPSWSSAVATRAASPRPIPWGNRSILAGIPSQVCLTSSQPDHCGGGKSGSTKHPTAIPHKIRDPGPAANRRSCRSRDKSASENRTRCLHVACRPCSALRTARPPSRSKPLRGRAIRCVADMHGSDRRCLFGVAPTAMARSDPQWH